MEDLERRLPGLTGAERGRALTELAGDLNNDNPRKAIGYGEEALAFYAKYPDPAREAHTLAMLAWAHMILSEYPTAIAIAGGLVYALVVENLLNATISGSNRWLPGQLIDAIARGGTSTVSYTSALLLVGAYLVVALGVAGTLFRKRDVAA